MTRRFTWAVVAGMSLLLIGACQKPQPEPEYEVTATIKDLMDSMVDPIADVLWDAVATIVTPTGTEERVPKSDEDWARVRRGAITLVEATNLLRMPGRRVARPGEKSENPKIELEPEEMQALIDKDRKTWNQLAHGLHAAAEEALRAIDSKSVAGLLEAGDKIDSACETCHLKYWYPNQYIPPVPEHIPPAPSH
jgi:cytochrome c556